MKAKIILILFLCAVLLGSLTTGSFSSYTTITNFGISIYTDSSKLNK